MLDARLGLRRLGDWAGGGKYFDEELLILYNRAAASGNIYDRSIGILNEHMIDTKFWRKAPTG